VSDFRILLVEDNAPDVLMVKEALQHYGLNYTLQHYTNGEAAAKAISAAVDAPDLFLLDLNVPRLHGLELLRMIRDQPRMAHVPVAILTSSRAAEDRAESEQRGADAYIVKPTSYSDFKTQVGQVIVELLQHKSRVRGTHRPLTPRVRRSAAMPAQSAARPDRSRSGYRSPRFSLRES
jgi:CheY-like chemotaxis protein